MNKSQLYSETFRLLLRRFCSECYGALYIVVLLLLLLLLLLLRVVSMFNEMFV